MSKLFRKIEKTTDGKATLSFRMDAELVEKVHDFKKACRDAGAEFLLPDAVADFIAKALEKDAGAIEHLKMEAEEAIRLKAEKEAKAKAEAEAAKARAQNLESK